MSPETNQLTKDLQDFKDKNPDADPVKFLVFWYFMFFITLFGAALIGAALVTLFTYLYFG